MKHKLSFFLFTSLLTTGIYGQPESPETAWRNIIRAETPGNLKISSSLYQLAKFAKAFPAEGLKKAADRKMRISDDHTRINVEIIYRKAENMMKIQDRIDIEVLKAAGLTPASTWKNRSSCWIDPALALDILAKLPADYYMEEVINFNLDNEGPANTNSNGYRSGAAGGGAGIRIAIFDSEYGNLQNRINNGVAPNPAYVWKNGAASTVAGVNVGGTHGTACVETIFDHAPNAAYEVYIVGNGTEMGAAINQCETNGVDIISHSMSRYNTGWYDNTGPYCDAVEDFIAQNRLFFTSSGNRAESHYEANYNDGDGDLWHQYIGADEQNTVILSETAYLGVELSWEPIANSDYDLYIYRSSDVSVVASSTNSGSTNFESAGETLSAGTYFISVKKKSAGNASARFEYFTHQDGGVSDYTYRTAAGSNTSPSNTSSLNCISVGAVSTSVYGTAAPAIASYSSQGPTNSGNLAPKMSSPTNTSVQGGSFGGTSCATPNLAGMAAAFWSRHSYLDGTGVRQIIMRFAQLYKDWGTAGIDYVYGYGGGFLYEYATSNRFMLRSSENNAITNATRPFYNLQVAQNITPANNTVIILNSGNYNETGIYGTAGTGTGKRILYRAPFSNVTGNVGF